MQAWRAIGKLAPVKLDNSASRCADSSVLSVQVGYTLRPMTSGIIAAMQF
jgi:hypothetical protein